MNDRSGLEFDAPQAIRHAGRLIGSHITPPRFSDAPTLNGCPLRIAPALRLNSAVEQFSRQIRDYARLVRSLSKSAKPSRICFTVASSVRGSMGLCVPAAVCA